MLLKENKKKIYLVIKIILGVIIYVVFAVYTPTFYQMSKEFFYDVIEEKKVVIIGDKLFKVKIAETQQERARGLSGTKEIKEGTGMFFIFDDEGNHGIWMNEMNYSIDIIWFDRFGKIIHIEKNVSPDTFPEVFRAEKSSKFVLEIGAGEADRLGLKLGDSIDLY